MTHGVWCEGEQTRGGVVVSRGSECTRRRAWGGSPARPSEGGVSWDRTGGRRLSSQFSVGGVGQNTGGKRSCEM